MMRASLLAAFGAHLGRCPRCMRQAFVAAAAALALLVAGLGSLVRADQATPAPYSAPLILAQSGHDQICYNNYNVCMSGCAASCSNQCKANLDGCLSQRR